jgi:ribonuclease BN (tRNA processing enzyme)
MSVKLTFAGSGDAFGAGGRFQTCLLIDAPGLRAALDFGASSLVALHRLNIAHNSIDAVVLTHIHGDHCGGLPFMLMDAMLGAKRTTPLTIAGPADIKARLAHISNALLPGIETMTPKFRVEYVEMETLRDYLVRGMKIKTFPADHTKATNPTAVRIEIGGKVIAYTGDGDWTEHIPALADGADLLIAECYFYSKHIKFHLNYPTIKERLNLLRAKRLVLTHMAADMLNHASSVPEEKAYDGLVIEL